MDRSGIQHDFDWSMTASLEDCAEDWAALEGRAICTPFQRQAWLAAARRAEPANRRPAIVVGRRDGRAQLIFPLAIERGSLGATLRWLGDRWNDYNLPIVDREIFASLSPDDAAAIWERVRSCAGAPSASILRRQVDAIDGLRNPFACWHRVEEPSKAHALTLGTDWEAFYSALFRSSTRKRMREKHRKLEAGGALVFATTADPSQMQPLLQRLLDWKAEQIVERGGRNALDSEVSRRFLADFIATPESGARMHALSVDGEPLAISLTLDGQSSLLVYQMAYGSGPLSRHSPGRVLVNHVMRVAVEEQRRLLDFTVGDEDYKLEICDVTTGLSSSIAAHGAAGRPAAALARGMLGLKRRLKANPRVLDLCLKAHAMVRNRGRSGNPQPDTQ